MWIKLGFINGLKQKPRDTDFHITPVLTLGKEKSFDYKGICFALEWGHWAVTIGFIIKLK